MTPTRRPLFHALSLIGLAMWGANLGIDIARFPHRWAVIALDIAMIALFVWSEMRALKEAPCSP